MTYVYWPRSRSVSKVISYSYSHSEPHSGDQCLKFIACLTEWALPEKRATQANGRTDTNFDYRAPPPEHATAATDAAARTAEREGAMTRTRYVAPFNLAFNTRPKYVRG